MTDCRQKGVNLLYLSGISVAASLVMWQREGFLRLLVLLAVNAVTAVISWGAAKKIFRDEFAAGIGAFLYTWAPYRFFSLGQRRDDPEAAAWALLPLLAYGVYWFLNKNEEKERRIAGKGKTGGKRFPWRLLFAGIGFYALGLLLLNGSLWVKDVKDLLQGQFALDGDFSLQKQGVYLIHYLMTYFIPGASTVFGDQGMVDSAPVGIGFLVTLGTVGYVWLIWSGLLPDSVRETWKKERRFSNLMLAAGILAAVLSSNSFPWDDLRFRSKLYGAFVILIQKPYRLMGIAMVCFWSVSCMTAALAKELWKGRSRTREEGASAKTGGQEQA